MTGVTFNKHYVLKIHFLVQGSQLLTDLPLPVMRPRTEEETTPPHAGVRRALRNRHNLIRVDGASGGRLALELDLGYTHSCTQAQPLPWRRVRCV